MKEKRKSQPQPTRSQFRQISTIAIVRGRLINMPNTQARRSGSEPGGGAMLSSQYTQPGVTFDGLSHNVSAPVAFFDCARRISYCSEDTKAERT